MEQEQTPKQVQPEDTKTISIEERDAKRELGREGVYPTAWKVAIHPREGRILYTVGIHHLSIILFNEPTVVHRLVLVATGVGLFTNTPRNALAKSQA